jgi:hypothetical protein
MAENLRDQQWILTAGNDLELAAAVRACPDVDKVKGRAASIHLVGGRVM